MADTIYKVNTYAALEAVAKQLGFWTTGRGGEGFIQSAGELASGGSYFLNHVGIVLVPTGNTITDPFGNPQPEMQALPGEWGRLRINGDSSFLSTIPAGAPITLYSYVDGIEGAAGFWSSDGITPAPDYIQNIGVIA